MNFYIWRPLILLLVMIFFYSCDSLVQKGGDCQKYENGRSDLIPVDVEIETEIATSYASILDRFEETSIEDINHEAYHFIWASAFGSRKSIKFEKKGRYNILTVKCIGFSDRSNCEDFKVEIDDDEWGILEEMIYEFHFWSAQSFRNNEGVADGFSILVVGNRPDAKFCGKQSYKLITRGNTSYDRMVALEESVSRFGDQLKFRYEQINDLNKKTDLKKLIESEFHN